MHSASAPISRRFSDLRIIPQPLSNSSTKFNRSLFEPSGRLSLLPPPGSSLGGSVSDHLSARLAENLNYQSHPAKRILALYPTSFLPSGASHLPHAAESGVFPSPKFLHQRIRSKAPLSLGCAPKELSLRSMERK